MTPAFRLDVEGEDVTERVRRHLVDLRVTLTADSSSDTLQITLSDAPGVLARPAAEREVRVSLGYRETGLVAVGVYYHSETDIELVPRRMVLRATAADFRRRSTLKAPKSRAWRATTLGQVVSAIAREHGYEPRVAPALAGAVIGHIDQTAESDMHLLRRLATGYDATVKAAGGYLVMMPRGAARSAGSGTPLPIYTASPDGGTVLTGRVSWRGRPKYSSVISGYHDPAAGKLVHVTAGSGDPAFVIREPRPDRAQALAAAAARLARLQRQTAALELSVVGEPTLAAQGRIVTSGWGGGTDGAWTISRVTHALTISGYESRVSAENSQPESPGSSYQYRDLWDPLLPLGDLSHVYARSSHPVRVGAFRGDVLWTIRASDDASRQRLPDRFFTTPPGYLGLVRLRARGASISATLRFAGDAADTPVARPGPDLVAGAREGLSQVVRAAGHTYVIRGTGPDTTDPYDWGIVGGDLLTVMRSGVAPICDWALVWSGYGSVVDLGTLRSAPSGNAPSL